MIEWTGDGVTDLYEGEMDTYPAYVTEDTDDTWEDVIKSDIDDVEEYRRDIEGRLEMTKDRTSRQALAFAAAKVLGRITPGLGDSYTLARIVFSDTDWCGDENLHPSNGGGNLWDPCAGRIPLKFHNADWEFVVPEGKSRQVTVRQASLIPSDYALDELLIDNLKEWRLTLPGSDNEASIDESNSQKRKNTTTVRYLRFVCLAD